MACSWSVRDMTPTFFVIFGRYGLGPFEVRHSLLGSQIVAESSQIVGSQF
jgi:hypothetical protein